MSAGTSLLFLPHLSFSDPLKPVEDDRPRMCIRLARSNLRLFTGCDYGIRPLCTKATMGHLFIRFSERVRVGNWISSNNWPFQVSLANKSGKLVKYISELHCFHTLYSSIRKDIAYDWRVSAKVSTVKMSSRVENVKLDETLSYLASKDMIVETPSPKTTS